MSFRCSNCRKPAPHGVSPFVVAGTEPFTHTKIGPNGETIVVGVGPQITFEGKLCPTCSGIPAKPVSTIDHEVLKTFSQGFARKHARSCDGTRKIKREGKETQIIPCQTCIDIQKTFAAMPASGMNLALEDSLAAPLKVSLAFLCVGGLEAQSERRGKRAARDFATSYGVLKPYEARGGGF